MRLQCCKAFVARYVLSFHQNLAHLNFCFNSRCISNYRLYYFLPFCNDIRSRFIAYSHLIHFQETVIHSSACAVFRSLKPCMDVRHRLHPHLPFPQFNDLPVEIFCFNIHIYDVITRSFQSQYVPLTIYFNRISSLLLQIWS